MKKAVLVSILVVVQLAVGVKAQAQQQAKIPLVSPFESRNWSTTQADAAARSEFERGTSDQCMARTIRSKTAIFTQHTCN